MQSPPDPHQMTIKSTKKSVLSRATSQEGKGRHLQAQDYLDKLRVQNYTELL